MITMSFYQCSDLETQQLRWVSSLDYTVNDCVTWAGMFGDKYADDVNVPTFED